MAIVENPGLQTPSRGIAEYVEQNQAVREFVIITERNRKDTSPYSRQHGGLAMSA